MIVLSTEAPIVKSYGGGRRDVPVTPNRLRQIREHARISLRVMADATGVNRQTLSRVERQQADLQDADKLTIAAFLSERTGQRLTVIDVFFAEH